MRNAGRPCFGAMALSVVDVALWDIKARLLGLPLVHILPPCHDRVPAHGSGGFTNYRSWRLSRSESFSAARPERSWANWSPAYSTPGRRHASCAWSDPGRPVPLRSGQVGTDRGRRRGPQPSLRRRGGSARRLRFPVSQIARSR
ncbi:hypothetical protein [Streptomyces coelicoflavus]